MIFFCTENHINTSKRKFPLYSRQQKYNWLKFQLLKQKEQLSRSKFAKRIPWSQTQFQKSLRWLWKQIELFPWILWCACAFFLSTVEAEAQARWSNLKTGGDHILGRYFGTIFWDDILVPYFGTIFWTKIESWLRPFATVPICSTRPEAQQKNKQKKRTKQLW